MASPADHCNAWFCLAMAAMMLLVGYCVTGEWNPVYIMIICVLLVHICALETN
jgi:hypothetical protein